MKRFLVVLFCILITNASVFADTSDSKRVTDNSAEIQTDSLPEKIKSYRSAIYASLELSSEQVEQIQKLDNNLHQSIEPELKKLDYLVKKAQDIAHSDDCTKEAINNIKKEFRAVENDMNCIKRGYDKEFIQILNAEQKSKYRLVRKQMRAELKKEMEEQKKLQGGKK